VQYRNVHTNQIDANEMTEIIGVQHDRNENKNLNEYSNKSLYNEDIEKKNDNASFEEVSQKDTYITINYFNMVEQMNTAQTNTDPEIIKEFPQSITMNITTVPNNHGSSLRPRPTR